MKSKSLRQKNSLLLSVLLLILCVSFSYKHVKFTGLPTSGEISMNMISAELGVPAQANFSLHQARLGTYAPLNPYSPHLPPATGPVKLTDWYGYCHTCTPIYNHTVYLSYIHPGFGGWASAEEACVGTRGNPITVYSSSASLDAGATLYSFSGNVYYPFNYINSGKWLYTSTGNKPIFVGSDNNITATSSCSFTLYWTFDNAAGSIYTNMYIYKNGVIMASRGFSDSGSFTCNAGDNIRVYLARTGIDGYTNIVNISGGYSYYNSNNTDTDIDTGTFGPAGNLYVTATVNNP